jgi:predicted Rossmann-fold nucleotide-binding protein
LPYGVGRGSLYSVDDLLAGTDFANPASFFECSVDARIYAHYQATRARTPVVESLFQRLHDHAMDDALVGLLEREGTKRVVAFMGGHAMGRDEKTYAEVAALARTLAREGYLVATGGGPGAMEAANLGASYAAHSEAELASAVDSLRPHASYKSDGWLTSALDVRARLGRAHAPTIGIPTWFYGHEPTNVFCTHVAKYFSNALREEVLLALARHGVVYARGGPGTMQEVFMDLCQNAYGTYGDVSPMIFVGKAFWQDETSGFRLVQQIAKGKQVHARLLVTDDPHEVVQFIKGNPPTPFAK